jgi:hypothetical protein
MARILIIAGAALAAMAVCLPAAAQGPCSAGAARANKEFVHLYNGGMAAFEAGQYALAAGAASAAEPFARNPNQFHALIGMRIAAFSALRDLAGLESTLPALKASPCTTTAEIASLEGALAIMRPSPDQ